MLTLSKIHDCQYLCPPALDEDNDPQRFGYLRRSPGSPFLRWLGRVATESGWCHIAAHVEAKRFIMPTVVDGQFDYIFVHDLYLLPHFSNFRKTRVIFDAREYYPMEFSDNKAWAKTVGKLARHICLRHMPKVYRCITVSPSIVKLYEALIGCPIGLFPSYPREDLYISPQERPIEGRPIRLIHHGNAFRNRGLEKMIELMAELGEGYSLDMMLVNTPGNKYFEELKQRIKGMKNVRIIPPVHPDEIIETCSEYDVGLYLMEVNDSQNRYCLPNKYFEFLYAGLPVITSFSEDMRYFTDKYGVGMSFGHESVKQIAEQVRQLTPIKLQQYRDAIKKHVVSLNVTNNIKTNFPELLDNKSG